MAECCAHSLYKVDDTLLRDTAVSEALLIGELLAGKDVSLVLCWAVSPCVSLGVACVPGFVPVLSNTFTLSIFTVSEDDTCVSMTYDGASQRSEATCGAPHLAGERLDEDGERGHAVGSDGRVAASFCVANVDSCCAPSFRHYGQKGSQRRWWRVQRDLPQLRQRASRETPIVSYYFVYLKGTKERHERNVDHSSLTESLFRRWGKRQRWQCRSCCCGCGSSCRGVLAYGREAE